MRLWDDISQELAAKHQIFPETPAYDEQYRLYREEKARREAPAPAAVASLTEAPATSEQPSLLSRLAGAPKQFAKGLGTGFSKLSLGRRYLDQIMKGGDPYTAESVRLAEPPPEAGSLAEGVGRGVGGMLGDPIALPAMLSGNPAVAAGGFAASAAEQARLSGASLPRIAGEAALAGGTAYVAPMLGGKVTAKLGEGPLARMLGFGTEVGGFTLPYAVKEQVEREGIPKSPEDWERFGGRAATDAAEMAGVVGVFRGAKALAGLAGGREQPRAAETEPQWDFTENGTSQQPPSSYAEAEVVPGIPAPASQLEDSGRLRTLRRQAEVPPPRGPTAPPVIYGEDPAPVVDPAIEQSRQAGIAAEQGKRTALRDLRAGETADRAVHLRQILAPMRYRQRMSELEQLAEQSHVPPESIPEWNDLKRRLEKVGEPYQPRPAVQGQAKAASEPPQGGPIATPENAEKVFEQPLEQLIAEGVAIQRPDGKVQLTQTPAPKPPPDLGPLPIPDATPGGMDLVQEPPPIAPGKPQEAPEALPPAPPPPQAQDVALRARQGEVALPPEAAPEEPVGGAEGATVENLTVRANELRIAELERGQRGERLSPEEQASVDAETQRVEERLALLEQSPPEVQDVVSGAASIWMRPPLEEGTVPTAGEQALAGTDLRTYADTMGMGYYKSPTGEFLYNPRHLDQTTMGTFDRAGHLLEIVHGEGNGQKPVEPTHAVVARDPRLGGQEVRTVLTDTPEKTQAAVEAQPPTLETEVLPAAEAIPAVLDERAGARRPVDVNIEEGPAAQRLARNEAFVAKMRRERPDEYANNRVKIEGLLAKMRQEAEAERVVEAPPVAGPEEFTLPKPVPEPQPGRIDEVFGDQADAYRALRAQAEGDTPEADDAFDRYSDMEAALSDAQYFKLHQPEEVAAKPGQEKLLTEPTLPRALAPASVERPAAAAPEGQQGDLAGRGETQGAPALKDIRAVASNIAQVLKSTFKIKADEPWVGREGSQPIRIYLRKKGLAGKEKVNQGFLEISQKGELARWVNVDRVAGRDAEREILRTAREMLEQAREPKTQEGRVRVAASRALARIEAIGKPMEPIKLSGPSVPEMREELEGEVLAGPAEMGEEVDQPQSIGEGRYFLGLAPNGKEYSMTVTGSVWSRRPPDGPWAAMTSTRAQWEEARAKVFPTTHQEVQELEQRIPRREGQRGAISFRRKKRDVAEYRLRTPRFEQKLDPPAPAGWREVSAETWKALKEAVEKPISLHPKFRDWPVRRNEMRIIKDAYQRAETRAMRELRQVMEPVRGGNAPLGSMEQARRLVILGSELSRMRRGITESYFDGTPEELRGDFDDLNGRATPQARELLRRHVDLMWKTALDEFSLGFLPEEVLARYEQDEIYFPHFVLDSTMMQSDRMKWLPKGLQVNYRTWTHRVKGSTKAYNTNYFDAMMSLLTKVYLFRELDLAAQKWLVDADMAPLLDRDARKALWGAEHPELDHLQTIPKSRLAEYIPAEKLDHAEDTYVAYRAHPRRWSLAVPQTAEAGDLLDMVEHAYWDTVPDKDLPGQFRTHIIPWRVAEALEHLRGGQSISLLHKAMPLWKRAALDTVGTAFIVRNLGVPALHHTLMGGPPLGLSPYGDLHMQMLERPLILLRALQFAPQIARALIGEHPFLESLVPAGARQWWNKQTHQLRGRPFDVEGWVKALEQNSMQGVSLFGPQLVGSRLQREQRRLHWMADPARTSEKIWQRLGAYLTPGGLSELGHAALRPLEAYEAFGSMLQEWLPLTRTLIELDQHARGKPIRSMVYTGTEGMDPKMKIFYIARITAPDFGGIPVGYHGAFDFAAPFILWYQRMFNYMQGYTGLTLTAPVKHAGPQPHGWERVKDWANVKERLRRGGIAFAAIGLPMALHWWWNNVVMKDVEDKLPPEAQGRSHLNTPWTNADGAPRVELLPSGVDTWEQMIGLANASAQLGRWQRGEISLDEARDKIFDPNDQLYRIFKQVGDLMPVNQVLSGVYTNKHPITGEKIVPGWVKDDSPEARYLRIQFIARMIIPPLGRIAQDDYKMTTEPGWTGKGSAGVIMHELARWATPEWLHTYDEASAEQRKFFNDYRDFEDQNKDFKNRVYTALVGNDLQTLAKLDVEFRSGLVPSVTQKEIDSMGKSPTFIEAVQRQRLLVHWDEMTEDEREQARQTLKTYRVQKFIERVKHLPKGARDLAVGQLILRKRESGRSVQGVLRGLREQAGVSP